MSCAEKTCSSGTIVRLSPSIDMDWPWPNWFHDLAPSLSRMWRKRRERRRLLQLDDRMLADIGLTREQAEQEARKRPWR
jgi:uncharacterized protein YjiS (DUF1127 family)